MKITKEEVLSVVSELMAGVKQSPHKKDSCIFCQITENLITADPKEEINQRVWAPLIQECMPREIATLWFLVGDEGFNKLIVFCIALGYLIGRRQVTEELTHTEKL